MPSCSSSSLSRCSSSFLPCFLSCCLPCSLRGALLDQASLCFGSAVGKWEPSQNPWSALCALCARMAAPTATAHRRGRVGHGAGAGLGCCHRSEQPCPGLLHPLPAPTEPCCLLSPSSSVPPTWHLSPPHPPHRLHAGRVLAQPKAEQVVPGQIPPQPGPVHRLPGAGRGQCCALCAESGRGKPQAGADFPVPSAMPMPTRALPMITTKAPTRELRGTVTKERWRKVRQGARAGLR